MLLCLLKVISVLIILQITIASATLPNKTIINTTVGLRAALCPARALAVPVREALVVALMETQANSGWAGGAMVLPAGTPSGGMAARGMELLGDLPRLLGSTAFIGSTAYTTQFTRAAVSPRTLLVLASCSPADPPLRLLLYRALSPLLRRSGSVAPWARDPSARLLLLCERPLSARGATDAQRALARAGVWSGALGIAPADSGAAAIVEGIPLGYTTSTTRADLLSFQPSRRPFRPPLRLDISNFHKQTLQRWPDVSGHSFVFVIYTNYPWEETACLNGFSPLWGDVLVETAVTISAAFNIRPLCYSKLWTYFGARLDNGSYSGLVESVVRGRADMLVYEAPAYSQWSQDAALLTSHHIDSLCVYVRRADPVPFFQCLFKAYKVDVWVFIGGSLVALVVTQALGGIKDPCFTTFRAFLVGTFSTRQRHARYLTFGTSVFGVLTLSVFQSCITSYITTPHYDREIDTFDEMAQKLSAIYVTPDWIPVLRSDDNPSVRHLVAMMRPIEKDWLRKVSEIINDGKEALLIDERLALFLVYAKSFTKEGYPLLYRAKQCVLVFPKNFVATKNSPYFSRMNHVLRTMFETGITKQLWERTEFDRIKRFDLVHRPIASQVLKPYSLSVNHVLIAFIVLIFGYIASFIVFVAENMKR